MAGAIVLFLPFLSSDNAPLRVAIGAAIALASLLIGPTATEWGRLPRASRPVAPIAR
jgi:hypothetical protein